MKLNRENINSLLMNFNVYAFIVPNDVVTFFKDSEHRTHLKFSIGLVKKVLVDYDVPHFKYHIEDFEKEADGNYHIREVSQELIEGKSYDSFYTPTGVSYSVSSETHKHLAASRVLAVLTNGNFYRNWDSSSKEASIRI